MTDERVSRATERYELATFGGDPSELDLAERDLDAAEADLALARGRIAHARFFMDGVEDPLELVNFERAARLYRGGVSTRSCAARRRVPCLRCGMRMRPVAT